METRTEPILQFFAYDHLPEYLQKISSLFCNLADKIVENLPRNPERTVALRKLLESKDCADRAYKDKGINIEVGNKRELLLQFFSYDHLPEDLQKISKSFGILSVNMISILPRNPERTVALRKLLESKDCAVRASLYK